MLYLYVGTDSKKIRSALSSALAREKRDVVRITDAHTVNDLEATLSGAGMFSGPRAVVLEGVLMNEDMQRLVLERLPHLRKDADEYHLVETVLNADTRKRLEKYAESTVRADAAKEKKETTVFALANALQAGKKKEMWVGYQRELTLGNAPEAIHGVLFWAAKQQLLRKPTDARARRLVAELAELPHEARRRGFDLEHALELFALSLT